MAESRFRRSITRLWTGTEREVEESIRRLRKQYKTAQKELEGRLADLYANATEDNLPSRRRLEAMLEEYKVRHRELNTSINRKIEGISAKAYTCNLAQ